jgi:hypothetical protein
MMEQEDAQATLAKGLQLEKGDLDKLITEFEQLVCHAGYDINQDLVLQISPVLFPTPCMNTSYGPYPNRQHTSNGDRQQLISNEFTFI